MRLTHWCAVLLLLAYAGRVLAAEAPVTTLRADSVQLDLNGNTAEATGNAELSYQNVTLLADHIIAHRDTGEVQAEGHLRLRQETRQLTGGTLRYNVDTQSGDLTNARLLEQGVIIRGERIAFSPKQIVAYQASFTTCDRPVPDYAITAERITLTATQPAQAGATPTSGRLSLHRAHIVYHGRRIVALPSYTTTVGQIQSHRATLLPTGGFSHLDGPYANVSRSLTGPNKPLRANLQLRLSMTYGFRGFLDVRRTFTPSGPAEAFFRLSRREDIGEADLESDQVAYSTHNVLLSREPEVGVRTAERPLNQRLRLSGGLAAGHYTEIRLDQEAGRVRGERVSATALLRLTPRRVSPRLSLSHAVGLRYSAYSGGEHLGVGYLRNTVDYTFGNARAVSLSYIDRRHSGTSPFQFDSPDIRQELLADVRYRVNPGWGLRVMNAYDLHQGRARDVLISATRLSHCLEYTVGWRKLRGTIFFGINLAPSTQPGAPPAAPAPLPFTSEVAPVE